MAYRWSGAASTAPMRRVRSARASLWWCTNNASQLAITPRTRSWFWARLDPVSRRSTMASASPAAQTPSRAPPIGTTVTSTLVSENQRAEALGRCVATVAPVGASGRVRGDRAPGETSEPAPAVVVTGGNDQVRAGGAQRHGFEMFQALLE